MKKAIAWIIKGNSFSSHMETLTESKCHSWMDYLSFHYKVFSNAHWYVCQPFLMTPYWPWFNLKAQFTCLHGLRVAPDQACKIITVCVVLHNTANIRMERGPPVSQYLAPSWCGGPSYSNFCLRHTKNWHFLFHKFSYVFFSRFSMKRKYILVEWLPMPVNKIYYWITLFLYCSLSTSSLCPLIERLNIVCSNLKQITQNSCKLTTLFKLKLINHQINIVAMGKSDSFLDKEHFWHLLVPCADHHH